MIIGNPHHERSRASPPAHGQPGRLSARTAGAPCASDDTGDYRELFESAPVACLSTDLHGRIRTANREARRLLAPDGRPVPGKPLARFVTRDDRANLRARLSRMATHAEPLHWDMRMSGDKHGTREVSVSAVPIRDRHGVGVGVCWVLYENPAHPLLEQAGRHEEEFRALVEHSPDLVSRYGPGLRRTYANPAFAAYLDRPASGILGKTNRELGIPEVDDALAGVFATGLELTTEFSLPTRAGERLVESRLVPERGPDGQVASVLVISRDITARKRAERELRRTSAELDRNNRRLEEANRELEQFAFVAAHDLKAPLRAVGNLADWIEKDYGSLLPDAGRGLLGQLRARVLGMNELIEGLLDFARAGNGKGPLESVSCAELVAEVVAALAPGITVEVSAQMPCVYTTRSRLRQAFANLIENAVKYHDRADGHVWVAARDLGEFYEFTVRDDGPGIAPEYHERIFRMLQRGPDAKRAGGTGIGLAVVRKVVERAGGRVSLESAPGQGATFRFTWPKRMPAGDSAPGVDH